MDNAIPPLWALRMPPSAQGEYDSGYFQNELCPISRLNILIGPNNSGKSRLLRQLFLFAHRSEMAFRYEGHEADAAFVEAVANAFQVNSFPDKVRNKYRTVLTSLHAVFLSHGGRNNSFPDDTTLQSTLSGNLADAARTVAGLIGHEGDLISRLDTVRRNCRRESQRQVESRGWKSIYIPTLRGMRMPTNERSFYASRTIADYFPEELKDDSKKKLDERRIFTGQDMYDILREYLLGTQEQRDIIARFQEFLGTCFFNGKSVTLIPRHNTDIIFVKVGNDPEFPVHQLGDGIQQIVIILFPVFIHRNSPLMLFVEEPEVHLHPGFQRLLIEQITREVNPSLHVFVTTHSHQFLDLTIEQSRCSVFRLCKVTDDSDSDASKSRFAVSVLSTDKTQALADIGVHNSSLLLANCTIWVEGISDRLYIRKFLELIGGTSSFQEDIHYAFIEYGGGNLEHFGFATETGEAILVQRIARNVLVIADSDERKDPKHERMRTTLGDHYVELPVVEIENLLTPGVIKQVVQKLEPQKTEIEEFVQNDYRTIRLGHFIEGKIRDGSKRRSKSNHPYAEKSGTIKKKVDFCRKAIEFMKTRDDLSPEALSVALRIVEFIKRSNPSQNGKHS